MNNQSQGAIVIDTTEGINAFRLLAIKSGLKLETKGMKLSRGTACSVHARTVLKEAGKKAPANKTALLAEFETHLREIGVLVDAVVHSPKEGYLLLSEDGLVGSWQLLWRQASKFTLANAKKVLEAVKESAPDAVIIHV